jgi:hypothetical protein
MQVGSPAQRASGTCRRAQRLSCGFLALALETSSPSPWRHSTSFSPMTARAAAHSRASSSARSEWQQARAVHEMTRRCIGRCRDPHWVALSPGNAAEILGSVVAAHAASPSATELGERREQTTASCLGSFASDDILTLFWKRFTAPLTAPGSCDAALLQSRALGMFFRNRRRPRPPEPSCFGPSAGRSPPGWSCPRACLDRGGCLPRECAVAW